MANEIIYKTQGDLNVVKAILKEAEEGAKNKNINMTNSKFIKAGTPAGAVAALSAGSALSGLLTVSAFVIPGINIIAGPLVLLPIFGVGKLLKEKKLNKEKELAYKDAIAKQNAIIKALQEERNADKERIEYLENINKLLKAAIKDLKNDIDCYKSN